MEIPGPASHITSTLTLPTMPATPPWRVGQRLDAQVISFIGQDSVNLKIGTHIVEAHSDRPVLPGQQLQLEVVSLGRPVQLRVLASVPQDTLMAAALRTALPHQQPLQAIFSHFTTLLASPHGLSPAVTALLKQLLETLPARQTLGQPEALKRAVLDSGIFLEHRLTTDPTPGALQDDLKANLLRLGAEIGQPQDHAAHNLAQGLEAGLARVLLHQLSALPDPQSPPTVWAGEIPVRDGQQVNVFQFHIEKDPAHTQPPGESAWSTWLSFDISPLGPMYVKISLRDQYIATVFWAEQASTVDLVKRHQGQLIDSLRTAGIQLRELQCLHGKPVLPQSALAPTRLLDITA